MLQNLIITTSTGIPLFARSLTCNIGMHCIDLSQDTTITDEIMINSGLFNAILIYNKAEPNNFHSLNLEKTNLLTYLTEDITVIFSIEAEDDPVEYQNRLKIIVDLFLDLYADDVRNFDGRITHFANFQKVLEENEILEPGENFRKNCIDCTYDKACTFRIVSGSVDRTLAERFAAIGSIGIFRKMFLIIKGMLGPKNLKP